MRIVLVILLYLGIISGCTKKAVYPEAMSQAIQCMEARPDSALLYLACLSDSMLEGEPEETRMYYQMLTVMAHDKSYHRHTSDSLINTIVRFYDNYGNLYKKMEAYYYLASVYRDLNDAPRAIKIFQQVADLGKNCYTSDIKWRDYDFSDDEII